MCYSIENHPFTGERVTLTDPPCGVYERPPLLERPPSHSTHDEPAWSGRRFVVSVLVVTSLITYGVLLAGAILDRSERSPDVRGSDVVHVLDLVHPDLPGPVSKVD